MQCRDCGEEFPNLNALTQHKKTCPVLMGKLEGDGNIEDEQREPNDNIEDRQPEDKDNQDPKQLEGFIIPLELCPEEIKYYAQGKVLGLRLIGKLVDNGVLLQEVTLIR